MPDSIELERYELFAGPAYRFEPDRRDFFKLLGGGIIVCFALADTAGAQDSGAAARRGTTGGEVPEGISAWVHIGCDSKVMVFTGKVQVGENRRNALTQ